MTASLTPRATTEPTYGNDAKAQELLDEIQRAREELQDFMKAEYPNGKPRRRSLREIFFS